MMSIHASYMFAVHDLVRSFRFYMFTELALAGSEPCKSGYSYYKTTDAGCTPNQRPHLAAMAENNSHTDAAVDQLITFATSVSALYLCSLLPPKLLLYVVQDTQSNYAIRACGGLRAPHTMQNSMRASLTTLTRLQEHAC